MIDQEYHCTDKSVWGPGEWQQEPDKAQWTDVATGMPCLIVRGPMGALCGYVGVNRHHPLYEMDYYEVEQTDDANLISVHGGLTFADKCGHGHICHVVEPGEDDEVWWFGFDCAHHQDLIPIKHWDNDWEIYRNWAYVKAEVTNLASQLNSWGK